LEQPVLVVDPSPEMLQPASKREGVLTLEATFDDFISSHPHTISKYNKFVFNGCILLFPNLEASIAAFYKLLKPGDQLLIVQYNILIWKENLRTSWDSLNELEEFHKRAGFCVERGKESHSHSYSREKYFILYVIAATQH
uniref:Methyltransferase type 11 domain-containing protein n=1 Tax=Amphimedon queenslandica TaxID=400682 RepID=A0A1X7VPB5_AMPQE